MTKYLLTYTLYTDMGLHGYGDSTISVKGRGVLKEVDLERIRRELEERNNGLKVVFHSVFKLGD